MAHGGQEVAFRLVRLLRNLLARTELYRLPVSLGNLAKTCRQRCLTVGQFGVGRSHCPRDLVGLLHPARERDQGRASVPESSGVLGQPLKRRAMRCPNQSARVTEITSRAATSAPN